MILVNRTIREVYLLEGEEYPSALQELIQPDVRMISLEHKHSYDEQEVYVTIERHDN